MEEKTEDKAAAEVTNVAETKSNEDVTNAAEPSRPQQDVGGDKKESGPASVEKVNKDNVGDKPDVSKEIDTTKPPDPIVIDRTDSIALHGESKEKSLSPDSSSNLSELSVKNQVEISSHSDNTAADSLQSVSKDELTSTDKSPELVQVSSNSNNAAGTAPIVDQKETKLAAPISETENRETSRSKSSEIKAKSSEIVGSLTTESKASEMVETSTTEKSSEIVESLTTGSKSKSSKTVESLIAGHHPDSSEMSKVCEKVDTGTIEKAVEISSPVLKEETVSTSPDNAETKVPDGLEKAESEPKKDHSKVELSQEKDDTKVKSSEKIIESKESSKDMNITKEMDVKYVGRQEDNVANKIPDEGEAKGNVQDGGSDAMAAPNKNVNANSEVFDSTVAKPKEHRVVTIVEQVDDTRDETNASKAGDKDHHASKIERKEEETPNESKTTENRDLALKTETKVTESKTEDKDHHAMKTKSKDIEKLNQSKTEDKDHHVPKTEKKGAEKLTESKTEDKDYHALKTETKGAEKLTESKTEDKDHHAPKTETKGDEKLTESKIEDKDHHASKTVKKGAEKLTESKTEDKDHHASKTVKKDPNSNNNAKDVDTDEGAGKDASMGKESVRPKDEKSTYSKDVRPKNEKSSNSKDVRPKDEKSSNSKEVEAKKVDSGVRTQHTSVDVGNSKVKADSRDGNKMEEKKDTKEESKTVKDKKEEKKDIKEETKAVKDGKEENRKEVNRKEDIRKEDVRKDVRDTRDRPSKSYSAQRTANRGSRRGNMEETKDAVDTSRTNETKLKDERRNRVERERDRDYEKDKHREKDRDRGSGKDRDHEKDRIRDRDRDRPDRDRDRYRDGKGRDQARDRGSYKESESEKSKIRDDRRDPRERKSTPPTQESRRARTREEREQEEQERRKRDEERRKKRDDERKQLEEDRKKREEEKKKAEEERKLKEEEEKKLAEERKAEEERKRQEEEQKRLEEEAARLKEEEEKHAREISVEAIEKKEAKMEIRKKNLTASDNRPDESYFTKLDSSLKKNTAFVKKLKVMNESQRLSLTKEFNTLNLTKYVGEVATSIAEAKLKMSDIGAAIHICGLVHQRYAEFSSHLLQAIQKVLPALPSKKDKDKDEQKTIVFDSKLRVELRFLAELIVAGVFTEKEGLPVLNGVLSVIINSDKESHSNLPIIISFTKHCGEDFAGCVPRKNRILAEKFGLTLPTSEVFSPEVKKAYTNLLRSQYGSVSKYLVKKHKDFQKLERQNLKMLQTKGELSDERKKLHEETQTLYQKLLMNTSTLSDLIDEEMPDLPIDEKLQEENELMAMDFLRADGSVIEFDFETSLWEDEDTKTFHENLIDLRTSLPAILFKGSEKRDAPGDKSEEDLDHDEDIQAMEVDELTEEENDTEHEDEGKTTAEEGESESGEPETEEPDDDDEEEEGPVASTNVSMKVLLDAFIQRLPECVNRDFIDKAAVDFCMNLNTKSNRKKLVKALFNVPRTRLDLLSFYSRLVATLYPCMPDIATDLVEKLKQEFRWHVRKKDQMKIESKIKVVRFLGELTKFKMCPKADTLHALKQLLLIFNHHHIDMACNLLDVCGRYLYRSKDSHLRTKALLDVMMRKRNKMHMNERHSTMVENAFYYCNPPESKQMEQKVRPPLHEYIRKLLFKDLTKITVEKVLKQMRKLPWNDLEIRQYAVKCLSSVWNVKFNNVHCMANLLAGLVLYHDYVGIQVVDAVLEDIRIGMEINHPKFNQRRVSVVKYLGELYNYRMVESSVIFKTMYSFIRFGIALDANIPSPLDPPEHLFRVRLTVTLLDTCGQFFDRGTSKKKLDCFLLYFQQYILFKRGLGIWNKETRPFPLDVDNAIADTFESVRPKLKMFTTIEEANDAVQELEKEYKEKLGDVINLTRVSQQPQQPGGPLSTISESEETKTTNGRRLSFVTGTEDEEESDSDMDMDRERRLRHDHSNPDSQSQGYSQNTEEAYDTEENMVLESAGENEEDDRVTVLTGGPRFVKCEEDEEFTSAFDKMMSDNIQQRTIDASKVPQIDIAVPVTARNKPKKSFDLFKQENNEAPAVTMNFTLMTRSGKKQQYHDFEVPMSSELAANLRNREMAEMAEKQKMKELTLNINERQEEEDYAEMIASLQKPAMATPGVTPVVPRDRKPKFHHPKEMIASLQKPAMATPGVTPVVPRDRKPKFHHPKGAPDMEQIFHQTGNRKW